MKKFLRISISLTIFAAVIILLAVLSSKSAQERHETTCTGLKVTVLDSAKLGFVTKDDVKNMISKEYGVFMGQRIDSVALYRIEKILDGRSAVLKSQAYTTPDGILHVDVTQREPVVMFDNGVVRFYADETGYVFPPVDGYEADIPVISGSIPMEIERGYKGEPRTSRERRWLMGIISMLKYLDSDKSWNSALKAITIDDKGDLVMYPVKGKERFIFGRPEDFKDKFRRLEDYYRYIVPAHEEGYYTIVNVKFDGQIVCRRK